MRKDLKIKKLQLNRETLHSLEQTSLAEAFGGLASNDTQCVGSACETSCNTCNSKGTCTTRFC